MNQYLSEGERKGWREGGREEVVGRSTVQVGSPGHREDCGFSLKANGWPWEGFEQRRDMI